MFTSEADQATEQVQRKGGRKRKQGNTAGNAAGGSNAASGSADGDTTGGTLPAAGEKKPRKGKQQLEVKPAVNPKAVARAKEILAKLHKARQAAEAQGSDLPGPGVEE